MGDSIPLTEPLAPQDVAALRPHSRNEHSLLLDFAYDEYCRAMDRGDSIDQQAFAARYPEIEHSLLELLEVHSFVVGNSLLTAVEPEIRWPSARQVFLGFELLEEIGKGAFSRVFLAKEVGLGNRQVVVKVSQKGTTEATMLGRLDHPNIIPIHSITPDHANDLSALCMPYLGRATAAEWIQTRFKASSISRLKSGRHLQSVIEIGKGVCQGLQFAHARQILHCDIKPSNILITHDGEPVILDFNLSTNPTEDIHLLGGTLMYMAPEQILRAQGDRTATITEGTDVFCLGATLYQMATGQLPFPLASSASPRLKDVMESALAAREDFQLRNHSLPEPLRSTFRDALAFDPSDRIASVNDFYERLSTCQDQLLRPRRRANWALAAVGTLTLGLLAFYQWNADRKTSELLARTLPTSNEQSSSDKAGSSDQVDVLQLAQDAEREGRYEEAISLYSDILDGKSEIPNLEEVRGSLMHSHAFCQLMAGQYRDANITFSRLERSDYTDEALELNKVACAVFFVAISPEGRQDYWRIKSTVMAVKNLAESRGKSAEHHHVLAIMHALLSNLNREGNRELSLNRAIQDIDIAHKELWLSEGKTLALGHLLPAAKDYGSLRKIITNHPNCVPDLTLEFPVQSPLAHATTMAKGMLP